jgi:hypothetical protein
MADYFNISFLTKNGRAKDLFLLCSNFIFHHFQHLLVELKVEIKVFQYKEDENFVWIEFADSRAKDIVEDYFIRFNLLNRNNHFIAMPDVFEGEKEAKQYLCIWYLNAIEEGFKAGFEGAVISIPHGISEDDPTERMFMSYSKEGMKGLFTGSHLFDKSSIRYINFQH